MRIAILRTAGVAMHRRRESMVQILKDRGHAVRFFDIRFISSGPVALRATAARIERGRVRRVLDAYKPEALITFEPEGLFALRSSTAKHRLYDVEEVHGDTTHAGKARKDWVQREHLAATISLTGISYLSPWMQKHFADHFDKVPHVIVSNALAASVGHDDGSLRQMAGLTEGDHILLYHGYLKPGRGLEWLAGMGDSLPKNWQIILMGHGEQEAAIRKAAKGRVTFLPPISEDRLPNVIAGATLGAILYDGTSLNHVYSTPNKLYELPAAGVPIWSEDLPALKAEVEGGNIGWVLPKTAALEAIHAMMAEATSGSKSEALSVWFASQDLSGIAQKWASMVEGGDTRQSGN